MGHRDPRIDAYIAGAVEFARPVTRVKRVAQTIEWMAEGQAPQLEVRERLSVPPVG